MSQKLNILKNVVVVSLSETTLWTGRAKMKAEDFGLNAVDLPPEEIASLGSKRLISVEALKPLQQIRYQLRRACGEVGTQFLGGYAVSISEAEKLVEKLNGIVAVGEQRKKVFMANFEMRLREWHAANPNWKHILSAGTPEKDRIENRINFGFQAYLVQTPQSDAVASNLLSAVDKMGDNIVSEIVQEADIFVARSLSGARVKGTQRTAEPMRRLERKIRSLCFVDPFLSSLADVIKGVLDSLPATGKIEGEDFLNLARLGYLLADRRQFIALSKGIHEGVNTVEEVIEQIMGTPTPETARAPLDVPVNQAVSLSEVAFEDDFFDGMPASKQEEVLAAVADITSTDLTTTMPKAISVNDFVDF